ncbi:MAG: hypothetical protein U0103_11665 [Candidatus Obscuribacterales bacterium]
MERSPKEQAISGMRAAARKHQTMKVSLQEVGAYKPSQAIIRVGDLLMSAGLVTEGDKISAIEMGLVQQQPVGQILVQNGMISETMLNESLKPPGYGRQGNLTGVQAADILRALPTRNCPIETILSERNARRRNCAGKLSHQGTLKQVA